MAENGNNLPLVYMENITRRFGLIAALENVDFKVDRREIVGLLGDNGAGKSTLIKVLTGVHPPSNGQIYFEGKPVHIGTPKMARRLGIETVYQDLALVNLMSISRNFFLGRELIHRIGPTYLLDKDAMNERTVAALADIGIEIRRPAEEVLRLSGGERQSIAIGRAAHFGQKLLILDEPTSALSVGETRKVLNYTLEAKRAGLSVIFITHNIGHVYQVADRFTIISHGHKVGDFMKGEVNQEEISSMIMGGEVPDRLKPVIEEREAELRKTRDSIAAATVSIVHAQQVRSRRNTILLSAAALAIIIFFAALLVGSGAFGSIEPTAVPTVVPTIDIATVPQDVLDQIALLQTSQNPDERALAATRLGAKKNLAAFDALVAALQDDAWQVRQAAIKALGKLADPRAIDPIEALMRDNYSEVRNAALAVLKDTYGLDCSDANGCPR